MNSCRLCLKIYLDKKESRHNLFSTKHCENNLINRLHQINILIRQDSKLSSTICRVCFRNLKKCEETFAIRKTWKNVLSNESSSNFSFAAKRLLSPSSKQNTDTKRKKLQCLGSENSPYNTLEVTTPMICPTLATNNSSVSKSLFSSRKEVKTTSIKFKITSEVINCISLKCEEEMSNIEKFSCMKDVSTERLIVNNDINLCKEFDELCPLLSAALKGAAKIDKTDKKFGHRLTCYASLFKARYPNNRSCVVAHRNDQLFIAAGVKRKAFKWFQKLGITNSYSTALRKNKQLSVNYDIDVLKWKNEIELKFLANETVTKIHFTENDESITDEISTVTGITQQETTDIINYVNTLPNVDILEELKAAYENLPTYQLIGDNIDGTINVRHQSIKNPDRHFHWFNLMAVKNRVHSLQDKRNPDFYRNMDVLPGPRTQEILNRDYTVLVARSIATFIPDFKIFSKFIPWHITHDFVAEMSNKSEVHPLGIIFRNENESSDMIEILRECQTKYVPQKRIVGENGEIDVEIIKPLAFGGDQLTEERAINVQKALLDGETMFEQMSGLEPKFEDWHLKVTLYMIKDKVFRNSESGSEFGTATWSINVLHSNQALKGPHENFNSYRDYVDKELDAQIVAATMDYFEMDNLQDNPIPEEIKTGSPKIQSEWFFKEVKAIIKKYVVIYSSTYENADKKADKILLYMCSFCDHCPFKTKNARDNHLRNKHIDQSPKDEDLKEKTVTKDFKLNYMKSSLSFNLLLRDVNDAIREGDGERLIELYKAAMLYMKCYGHTKYAYTMLKLLYRIKFQPDNAFNLIWCRFINTKGKIGKNISLDLHMEHLNNFLKELLKNLRSNLNEANADRVSKSMANIKKITDQMNETYDKKEKPAYRKNPKVQADVIKLATEMKKADLFQENIGREFTSFPEFNDNLLHSLDPVKLKKWIKKKETEFQQLYQN